MSFYSLFADHLSGWLIFEKLILAAAAAAAAASIVCHSRRGCRDKVQTRMIQIAQGTVKLYSRSTSDDKRTLKDFL